MRILDEWFRDIPQQFLGKKKIEIFIQAFAKQLEELEQVFDVLRDLDIDTASGKNLDYVGTIVSLSRKEAGELAGINITQPVISDERYRQFLRYKILRNTNDCTYYDLIAGIELLWKYQNMHYIEDLDYPATIIFETISSSLDQNDLIEFHSELCIRASGVGVLLRKKYESRYLVPVIIGDINLRIESQVYLKGTQIYLDGTWDLDGNYTLAGYRGESQVSYYDTGMTVQESVMANPKVDAFLIIERDLWYLDGEYDLNGEKKLGAEVQKHDLN